MSNVPGIAGYGEEAEARAAQYERLAFEEVHNRMLHLFPSAPARALDIGAGTGRDAAALARRGLQVTATEPTPELRAIGQKLHADVAIDWIADALPDLAALRERPGRFGLILMSAVWMHLDESERVRGMPVVAGLLAPCGALVLTLRHGPVPAGRRMFEVTAAETIALANASGLMLVHHHENPDVWLGRPGVNWTGLGFTAP